MYIMHRTQLYIDDDTYQVLVERARSEHTTISAIVRQALRCITEGPSKEEGLSILREAAGLWKDRSDLGSTANLVGRLRRGTRLARLARREAGR